MKTIEHGHVYDLQNRQAGEAVPGMQRITFVNTEEGHRHGGTTTQEVIRSLIDRTQYCDSCLPWSGNNLIVQHLRMALALHECRAIMTAVEKGELRPEEVVIDSSAQHFSFVRLPNGAPYLFHNRAEPTTETGSLNPGTPCHTKAHPAP